MRSRPGGKIGRLALGVALLTASAARPAEATGESLEALMPRVADYTLMGWASGFPGHTPSAPWQRVIRTGRYAMAMDTDTLRIPHLGAVDAGGGYEAAARAGDPSLAALPAAELALTLAVDGRTYRAVAGGRWSQFDGPRLIESGRWMQRADITDLVFASDDGARLNVEARLETVAWPDRLALIVAARPGLLPFPAGEPCFGRVGGGFGLDGSNHLEVAHDVALDPERFTLELWAFVPTDHQPSARTHPWLACKNRNEEADGNYGITLAGGRPQARLNIGGGRAGSFLVEAPQGALKLDAWNHLAIAYDGDVLRLYVNGRLAGERKIGRARKPGRDGLAFGRRQDNCGDGYHFRGAIDEIRIYDHALTADEIRRRLVAPDREDAATRPVRTWNFDPAGTAAMSRPGATWKAAELAIRFVDNGREQRGAWTLPAGQSWTSRDWHEAAVAWTPDAPGPAGADSVTVQATEIPSGAARPVEFDAARGWHRVNLDGIEPILPPGAGRERADDAIERVKLVLVNPASVEQPARLLLEKTSGGIRQRAGAPITGISAILRDADGQPTGIPVQLSKNWHNRPEGGVYAGQWFHGFATVRLPPGARAELELTIAYGHWGGVAAASHAQLCLIGWGSNQQWDESALGSWGESICYEPDQAQAECGILDVRPLMVRAMGGGPASWTWTHNVGGGDFFRLFDVAGRRVFPGGMRTAYARQGPCLTEVIYAGRLGAGIAQSATVSLARTDDLLRGIYRLRLDVTKPVEFARFVIFQIGADTYSYTGERKMALGSEAGLAREWATQWGGDTARTPPMECTGRVPWISLHEAVARRKADEPGAWANRGIVIREWNARLGGKSARPWLVERGVRARGSDTSTADLVPPPGVTRLEPGDFVEAVVEHVIVPQSAADYLGPNAALRAALAKDGDTWRMIRREAEGNDRHAEVRTGRLERLWPDVRIRAAEGGAECTLAGGLGYVPVTFAGLPSPRGWTVRIDGQPLDQGVHGRDFWQADHDAGTGTWSLTFNIPADGTRTRTIRLEKSP